MPRSRRRVRLHRMLDRVRGPTPSAGGETEAANQMVWDGERRGHYEVWYLTCNHRESRSGFWIRYTLESPLVGHGEPYAQLWFAYFDRDDPSASFAINRRFPIAALRAEARPFSVRIGESHLGHDAMRGELAGAGHQVRWDLRWQPATELHHHLPRVMYRGGGLGETTVLSPNLSVPILGTIEVDGRVLEFTGESGGQTHVWGRKHAFRWAWAHCTEFTGPNAAAFEALTVRLRRRGRTLPPLTILTLYLDGEVHDFTGFRFPLTGRTTGLIDTARYAFTARRGALRIRGEIRCRPQDMVVATYHDPDGDPSYCANTEVGDLWLRVERRVAGGWETRAELFADATAHFEIGTRERDPAILRAHQAVDDEPAQGGR
ncbi:MAG: hypothetical protein H6711_24240 [Myxococcales bacterium]|nr:hypothetical protein [Myxococcales bacterium]